MLTFKSTSAPRRQRGLSIVELMVSILIALIILAGVLQVVLTGKQAFVGGEDMAFIQENARYALDVIGRDVQSAGHFGCAGASPAMAYSINAADPAGALEMLRPGFIEGFSGVGVEAFAGYPAAMRASDIWTSPAVTDRMSDAFIVRRAHGAPIGVLTHVGNKITLNGRQRFANVLRSGEEDQSALVVMVAEDCRRVGIFGARFTDGANTVLDTAVGACDNGYATKPTVNSSFICTAACDCMGDGQTFQQTYNPGSVAMSYLAHGYFIRRDPDNADAIPSLSRVAINGDGEPVVEDIALGVEHMEVLYGEDTDSDRNPDTFRPAQEVSDWADVKALTVNLIFRSLSRSQTTVGPADADADSSGTVQTLLGRSYNDGYMRQLVSSTIRLRNRF